jgi:hypothetical protein
MLGVHMSDVAGYYGFSDELSLDFDKIESREVSLDAAAKNRIYQLCDEFLGEAESYCFAPPFGAETSRYKARAIFKKAVAAERALNELSLCSYDAVLHDLNLFEPEERNAYLFSVKRAISLVRKIEKAAEKRSLEPHLAGRPELRDFKHLVIELYRTYVACGGAGQITWDKNRKRYKGYPVFFILRVIDQLRPLVPLATSKKFLPGKESSISRTAAEAIKDFERKQKWGRKSANNGRISAFLEIRHFARLGDTVRS